jgi:hypothetical protein
MGRSTTVEIGEAMSDELPVVFLTIEEVRSELRIWQERGLQGTPRSDAERDRVSQLWKAVDDECRRELRRGPKPAKQAKRKVPPVKLQSFTEWLVDNPPPDLQALAEHYGGLGNVPEGVMLTFEAEREEWQQRLKLRHLEGKK